MRKLATIRKIKEIHPIPDADKIELAIVDGWNVVVAKDVGHKVGDTVIYCEIDSFLPIKPEYEFLRKTSYKKMGDVEGFRLKTIKLRGQVSQGLILPLSVIANADPDMIIIGTDIADVLGIVKYEPPIPAELSGVMKGNFPSFIPRTDQERVQNLDALYERWQTEKHKWYSTEKLDGTSFTAYLNDSVFGVCSRNLELLESDSNTYWKIARQLNIEENLRKYGKNIAVQGEIIGEGIQDNIYKIKGQTLRVFGIFDIDKQQYYSLPMFILVTRGDLELETVPILHADFDLPKTVDELLDSAIGQSRLYGGTTREGIVIATHDGSISFKAISNEFLIHKEK